MGRGGSRGGGGGRRGRDYGGLQVNGHVPKFLLDIEQRLPGTLSKATASKAAAENAMAAKRPRSADSDEDEGNGGHSGDVRGRDDDVVEEYDVEKEALKRALEEERQKNGETTTCLSDDDTTQQQVPTAPEAPTQQQQQQQQRKEGRNVAEARERVETREVGERHAKRDDHSADHRFTTAAKKREVTTTTPTPTPTDALKAKSTSRTANKGTLSFDDE